MSGVYADLHVHTDRSDGQLAFEDVPAAARAAGVAVVGLTDHDRLQGDLADPVTRRQDVTLVHGIELRVEAADQRVDLLGYGVEPTPALAAELERLQADRRERGAAIIDRVETRFDVDLGLEPRRGLGRPHIARAIDAHSDITYDYRGAFEELIGDDGPCFVPRQVTPFETGRELLQASCVIVGLAHPLRYPDPTAALELAASLDAIERYYPYEGDPDPEPVDRALETHDLLATGGSDAHDDELGRAGLSITAYEPVARTLSAPHLEGG